MQERQSLCCLVSGLVPLQWSIPSKTAEHIGPELVSGAYLQDVKSRSWIVRTYYKHRMFMGVCCISCEVLYLSVSCFSTSFVMIASFLPCLRTSHACRFSLALVSSRRVSPQMP